MGFSQGAQSAQRKGVFFLKFIPAGPVNSVRYLTQGTLLHYEVMSDNRLSFQSYPLEVEQAVKSEMNTLLPM